MVGAVYLALNDSILFPSQIRETSTMESLGKVSQSTNIVKRKFAKDVNWHDLAMQDDIFEEDSIFTEENANAEVTFSDGSKLYIDPSTLLTITRKNNRSSIDIRTGSISSNLKKGNELSITSKGQTQEVRGDNSQIQFNVSDAGKSELTVLSGDIKLKSGDNKEQTIEKNQVAIIGDNGRIQDVQQISINLKTPMQDFTSWQKKGGNPVNFSWESTEQLQSYQWQLSSDVNFKNIIRKEETSYTSLNIENLPINRILYWRVIGKTDNQEKRSPSYRLKILPDYPPQLVFPKNNSKVFYRPPENMFTKDEVKKGTEVNLRWVTPAKAPFYAIEVAKDNQFKEIIFSEKTADLSTRTIKIPPGIYSWRVVSIYTRNKRSDWSQISRFKVEPKLSKDDIFDLLNMGKLPAPTPSTKVKPIEGTYNPQDPKSYERAPKTLHLTWNPIEKATQYAVYISKGIEFKKAATLEKFTEINEFPVKIKAPGKYYWKVTALNQKKKKGHFSDPATFIINEQEKLPSPKLVITNPIKEFYKLQETISINWDSIPKADYYQIMVSNDPYFNEISLNKKVTNSSYSFKIDKLQNYYIRSRAFSDKKSKEILPSSFSESLSINIDVSIETPKITNKESRLSSRNKNYITWTPVNHTSGYIIEYSKDDDFDDAKTFNVSNTITKHLIPFKSNGGFHSRVFAFIKTEDQIKKGSPSDSFSFHLKKNLPAPQISFFKEQDPVFFIWKRVKGAKGYELEFFNKKTKRRIKSKTKGSGYKLEKLQKGHYSWRMRAIDQDNFPGDYTNSKSFTIINPGRIGICKRNLSSELLENYDLDKIQIDKETDCLIIDK